MNQDNLPSFHPRTSRTKSETSSPSSNESNNVLSKFQLEKHLGKRMLVTKENIEPILIESSKSSSEYFPVESKTHKNTQSFEIPTYNPFEPRPELTQQFELYSPTPFHSTKNKILSENKQLSEFRKFLQSHFIIQIHSTIIRIQKVFTVPLGPQTTHFNWDFLLQKPNLRKKLKLQVQIHFLHFGLQTQGIYLHL
ncbi:hypothetical protein C1H46_034778 [Malus baccata]|uniref:Uncharacterized protein n=1 Tax=Malus baccata TaxID=106549 RepID=A0A540KZN0_MALBA|nr:hypothetical protein C1H46_034778 [Malus baccata]